MIFFCVFKNIFPPLQPLWERVHIKAKKSENFLNKFANLKKMPTFALPKRTGPRATGKKGKRSLKELEDKYNDKVQ